MRHNIDYVLFMVSACFISMTLALCLVFLASCGWPDQDWPFLLGPFGMIAIVYWLERLARVLFGDNVQ